MLSDCLVWGGQCPKRDCNPPRRRLDSANWLALDYMLRKTILCGSAFLIAVGMTLVPENVLNAQNNTTVTSNTSSSSSTTSSSSTNASVYSSVRVTENVVKTRTVVETQIVTTAKLRKTAIFVLNRAGIQFDGKLPILEDQVTSRAGDEFSIISHEDALKAMKVYQGGKTILTTHNGLDTTAERIGNGSTKTTGESATATSTASGSTFPGTTSGARSDAQSGTGKTQSEYNTLSSNTSSAKKSSSEDTTYESTLRNTLGTVEDQALADNTSALRLAQNMGAAYVLFVNLDSYRSNTVKYHNESLGLDENNKDYILRGTYKIVEGVTGGTIGVGGAFTCSKRIQQSANLQTDEDPIDELIEQAGAKIAAGLKRDVRDFPFPQPVQITVDCSPKDLTGNEISLPDIALKEDNTVVKGGADVPVRLSAIISIDGMDVGTTPASIRLYPGIHKIRLSRPGFEDYAGTINVADGMSLTPALVMNASGFDRWKEIRTFLNNFAASNRASESGLKTLDDYVQVLRQNGYRVELPAAPDANAASDASAAPAAPNSGTGAATPASAK